MNASKELLQLARLAQRDILERADRSTDYYRTIVIAYRSYNVHEREAILELEAQENEATPITDALEKLAS